LDSDDGKSVLNSGMMGMMMSICDDQRSKLMIWSKDYWMFGVLRQVSMFEAAIDSQVIVDWVNVRAHISKNRVAWNIILPP